MSLTFEYDNERQDKMYFDGKWIGFRGQPSGRRGLEKCPECRRENYAMNVLSGICTWCGWSVHDA